MNGNGNKNNHAEQPLLTLLQFRELLQTSHSTVRKIVRNGEIQIIRGGGLIRIHPTEVEKFIKRHTERQGA